MVNASPRLNFNKLLYRSEKTIRRFSENYRLLRKNLGGRSHAKTLVNDVGGRKKGDFWFRVHIDVNN